MGVRNGRSWFATLTLLSVTTLLAGSAFADWVSDVRATRHNLSSVPAGTPTAGGRVVPERDASSAAVGGTDEVCVFCHTPHAATNDQGHSAPLWNRSLANGNYSLYQSTTIDAVLAGPGGSSKLCLSCHDGTIALGKINVLGGIAGPDVPVVGTATAGGRLAVNDTGFTRNLGTDLGNDHPISFAYDDVLSDADGELAAPADLPVGARAGHGVRLEAGRVQCGTCHDPHLLDADLLQMALPGGAPTSSKFIRASLKRFQTGSHPIGVNFVEGQSQICLACHRKLGWAFSAHANSVVADEQYGVVPGTEPAALQREFPAGLPVWRAACLNCHDTHTVRGAPRLLREGSTDNLAGGGSPAIEETCYQCHRPAAERIVGAGTGTLPDIRTDFTTAGNRTMPILRDGHDLAAAGECAGGRCGKDLLETPERLATRHAECSDCHNPHRIIRSMNGLPGELGLVNTSSDSRASHRHEVGHSNVISGALRGSWGVEPEYPAASFHVLPSNFVVKRGDPGGSALSDAAQSYVTREYQICLRCHSNYGYADDNAYPSGGTRPPLGSPGTQANANGHIGFTRYTNQAKEFQAPSAHRVQVGAADLGSDGGAALDVRNHRSWHPVMAPTGRTSRAANGFLAPWGSLGTQTMYCSDCHGSAISAPGTVVPEAGAGTGGAWGPHGSSWNFLLKGDYSTATGEGQESDGLCFKCHAYNRYAGGGGGTGFTTDKGDGHAFHVGKIDTPMRCNFCHVAVPHGFKNRNLLVNLNDVGPEAGLAPGTAVSYPNNVGYSNGPYYRRAFLRITSFPTGEWTEANCNGGKDGMRSNCENPN